MPSNKSPRPDGFTVELFKEAWEVVGKDVVVAIQSFFVKGFLPKGLNTTVLALIPKHKEAQVMKEYRPISCCNVIYKVISKILANRLKQVLPKFITKPISVCKGPFAHGECLVSFRTGEELSQRDGLG
ncbi:hypothetical protein V5N11_029350 [Cardamine amara subsp. amara]|uniref:Reverse transcriptase n=1 Tax=Cardamine amara subsp. amara TaxID=228776 RepID=A0ABD1AHA5_CARAN